MSAASRRRRWFLCDMENIHSRWARILPCLEPGDAVTMFVSDASGKPDLEILTAPEASGTAFYFERCDTGRPNAMDFQIACELGRLSVLHPDTDFIVVSDDKGYRSVTDYMDRHGTAVACIGTDIDEVLALVPAADQDGGTDPAQDPRELKKKYRKLLQDAGVSENDLYDVTGIFYDAMRKPQRSRKTAVLNGLRKRYGNEDGRLKYAAIKPVVHDVAANGPLPAAPSPAMDPDPTEVNLALGSAHVPLQKGMVAKICAAIQAARKKPRHRRNDLEKRLKAIVGLEAALPAARALEQFLRLPEDGK